MGGVYDECVRQLDRWRRQYADRPNQEIVRLFLLALEREEIVSVAYREAFIVRRLRAMPIPPDARQIIHHALIWTWKDEEMHAIYIRGAIFKLGNPPLRGLALLRQFAGVTGGWAGSVRQHVRWSEAPISRALATVLTRVGSVAGQVPTAVQQHLDYRPFRDFCLFNVDAERTAWLCFNRMVELVSDQRHRSPAIVEDFRRMQADEERHRRIFEILAAALDADDRLVPGETAEALAEKIGAIGEVFLPRARRPSTAALPLGGGGRVWVVRGTAAGEKLPLFRRLLDESELPDRLQERASALGKPVRDLRVAIKTTFMLGYHRKDRSPIADPALLQELARYLRALGCPDVAIVEARNIYDRFYKNRTVRDVARYFNIASSDFRVVDLSEEQIPHAYERGMGQYSVGRTWAEADFRIAFGKLRSHPVEMVALTVAQLEGLGARCDEFLFVERQAHRDTATMMLIGEFPPHFALLDGYDFAPDGVLGVMGSPRPRSPRRLYAGADALSVDIVAARHIGLNDPWASRTLRTARHWFGDPSEQIRVIGPDEPIAGWHRPYCGELSTLLGFFAYAVYQFGSSRGAVFVPEMDEEAFPPATPEGPLLGVRRRSLQALLGLRH